MNVLKQVSDKLAFNNQFVVIKNEQDLSVHRSNLNHKERISIVIRDDFEINRTYGNKHLR